MCIAAWRRMLEARLPERPQPMAPEPDRRHKMQATIGTRQFMLGSIGAAALVVATLLVGAVIGASLTYTIADGNDGNAVVTSTNADLPQSLNRPIDRGITARRTDQAATQHHRARGEGLISGYPWEMDVKSGLTGDRVDQINRLRASEPAIEPVYADHTRYIEMNTELPVTVDVQPSLPQDRPGPDRGPTNN